MRTDNTNRAKIENYRTNESINARMKLKLVVALNSNFNWFKCEIDSQSLTIKQETTSIDYNASFENHRTTSRPMSTSSFCDFSLTTSNRTSERWWRRRRRQNKIQLFVLLLASCCYFFVHLSQKLQFEFVYKWTRAIHHRQHSKARLDSTHAHVSLSRLKHRNENW